MLKRLSKVAKVNPSGPKKGVIQKGAIVPFVPMSSLREDGHLQDVQMRSYGDVSTGYTPFMRGDILVAKITPCFENNKIGIANIEGEYGFGSTEFHVIRCNADLILNKYLFYILRHEYVRIVGERRMTGSGGQRRVPQYFLEELEIPVPSSQEQDRIATALEETDTMRRLHESAANRSHDLLVLLTDRAFRGEL